jgi:hypothetical protein
MMPSVVLKNMVMGDLSSGPEDAIISGSVEFVSEMVSNLMHPRLSSFSFVVKR